MIKFYLASKWTWFWTCFVGSFFTVALVHAATVLLVGYVSTAILDSGGTPLADGSIVQIIGSGDNSISDPLFNTFGTSNLIAEGAGAFPLPDGDVLLGTTTINSSDLGSNGTFLSAEFTFETPDIGWVYLRVFDSSGPLTGEIDWGVSSIFRVKPIFGVAEVDFLGGFSTENTDTFVVIPEPGSGSLILVFMTLLFGVRHRMRSPKKIEVALQNSSLIDREEKDWL